MRALVAALDGPERVEGLHERDPERGSGQQARDPGHPEVGVHDVGPGPGLDPPPQEVGAERVHVGQEVVLGHGDGRTGVHVHDLDAARERDALREGRVVAAREHLHAVALRAEPRGERRDVHVLPARVDAAQGGEGAGVLRDHRDLHEVTSVRTVSQRRRNAAWE